MWSNYVLARTVVFNFTTGNGILRKIEKVRLGCQAVFLTNVYRLTVP